MARQKSNAVLVPNWGLYLDRPPLAVPPRALQAGHNFRIREGRLTNNNIGWTRFGDFTLNGPCVMIANFFPRGGTEHLIFATPGDLYEYDGTDDVVFRTPVYVTGSAAASGTAVTGTSTAWQTAGIKAGDEIAFGANDEDSPAADWFVVAAVGAEDAITLTATAGTVSDGPYTIRRKLTSEYGDHFDWVVFTNDGATGDDLFIMTNGVDAVISWDGAGIGMTYQSALGFTCKHLAIYANMLIYGDLIQGGDDKRTEIINSDIGEPLDVTTGFSEQFTVHGGSDPIIDMHPLGDYLVIYSTRHVTLVQFVGSDVVFAFRQSISNVGPFGPRLVADHGDFHEFLGPDSLFRYDGVSVVENAKQVWREALKLRDPARDNVGFTHFDEETGELIWTIAQTDDPDFGGDTVGLGTAWVEAYIEEVEQGISQPYSKRDFPFTASGYYEQQSVETWDTVDGTWADISFRWNEQFFFAAFPLSLVGDVDGKVYTINSSQSADGVALTSFAHFGRRPLTDGRMRGLLARLYPFAFSPTGGSDNLTLRMHIFDSASNPTEETDDFSFPLAQPNEGNFVSVFRRARFYSAEFRATTPWTIEGYDVDLKRGGMR